MELETLATIEALGSGIIALYWALRREITACESRTGGRIDGVKTDLTDRIDEVKADLGGSIDKLDGRVYALASGLRPQIEQAQSAAHGEVAARTESGP